MGGGLFWKAHNALRRARLYVEALIHGLTVYLKEERETIISQHGHHLNILTITLILRNELPPFYSMYKLINC